MRSAITVSLVPQAKGGPFVFWDSLPEACAAAAKLGFDAVEIFPPSADALDLGSVRQLLDEHRLKVAAVGSGAAWVIHRWHLCHADGDTRRRALEFAARIIDRASDLGAPAIIGSIQGRIEGDVQREQALEWLAEALAHLSQQAAARDRVIFYEPLNRYETNVFNRAGDAAAFLDEHGLENVKLLCDLFHMSIEERSIAGALRAVGPRLGHLHFVDSNRLAVGWGHTDIGPIVDVLREIGYDGYVSGEAFPLPDSLLAAGQTAKAFAYYFGGR